MSETCDGSPEVIYSHRVFVVVLLSDLNLSGRFSGLFLIIWNLDEWYMSE